MLAGQIESGGQGGVTRRNLNIQPTLTVRPGLPVRVIVNRDLVLRPLPKTEIVKLTFACPSSLKATSAAPQRLDRTGR